MVGIKNYNDGDMLSKAFKISNEKYECEDTPEVMELRRQRNEYTDKAAECQRKIDQLILEAHKVPDLTDKYVKIEKVIDDVNRTLCGKVCKMERLIPGVRLYFESETLIYEDGQFDYNPDDGSHHTSYVVNWDKLDSIEAVDREYVVELIKSHVDKIVSKI